jgi:hypothetical protein
MVGTYGIPGISEPAIATQPVPRERRSSAAAAPPLADGLEISPAASALARLLAPMHDDSEVRAEKVAKAIEDIEKGMHQIHEVVRIVAGRVSRYVAATD